MSVPDADLILADVLDGPVPFGDDAVAALVDNHHPDYTPEAAEPALAWPGPRSLDEADWCGRKWAQVDAEVANVDELAAAQIARIEAWRQAERARLEARGAFWRGHLLRFAASYREENPRDHKTLRLPSVVVKSTARQAAARIVDQEAVVKWAQATVPGWIEETVTWKVPASLVKNGLAHSEAGAVYGPTGEVVPGVVVDEAHVDYRIERA